jgi:hypothetical protein
MKGTTMAKAPFPPAKAAAVAEGKQNLAPAGKGKPKGNPFAKRGNPFAKSKATAGMPPPFVKGK